MSSTPNPFQQDAMAPAGEKVSAPALPLRWWPAAVLLVLMVAARFGPRMLESPPLPVLMISFMGPAALSLAILAWWLFASRANLKEKIVGLASVAGLAILTTVIAHYSIAGFGTLLYQFPTGIALFAVTLILTANQARIRLVTAILASLLGFGYFDLLRMDGVSGKFTAEFAWRWQPSAEDNYIKKTSSGLRTAEAPERSSVASDNSASTTASEGEMIRRQDAAWPDFRGPQRDGVVHSIALIEDWKTSPPKLIWKVPIGPGWSSFSLSGNRLFTQAQRGDEEEVVCLKADNGDTVWSFTYPGRFWEVIAGAGPRATPTIGDDGIYTFGANGMLLCLEPISGKERWKRDVHADSGRALPPQWGYASSPLVHNNLVIVHVGGEGNKGVFAYDAKTGEQRWSAASGDHSYSSAHLATFFGIEGLLMETNAGLQFLNCENGQTIWNHESPVNNYRALQPLVIGNSIVIATSLGEGMQRITVNYTDGKWDIREDWKSKAIKPDFNDFVYHQGALYGFDANIFGAMDFENGSRLWKKGRYGNGQVLLLGDSGQLLVIAESGELVLLKADKERLVELGKFSAIEGKTWNHAILVGNRIFVRNAAEAACYELELNSTPVPSS